jgi:hypothetical protein
MKRTVCFYLHDGVIRGSCYIRPMTQTFELYKYYYSFSVYDLMYNL